MKTASSLPTKNRAREVISKIHAPFMPTEFNLAKENAPEEYEEIDKKDKRDTDIVVEETMRMQKLKKRKTTRVKRRS